MKQPELGEKISQLRKNRNLTQNELAEMSHVGVRTIQRIESGQVLPRTSTIRLLLKTLGYDYQQLIAHSHKKAPMGNPLHTFFLIGKVNNEKLLMATQTSWIAGLAYFIMLIGEGFFDYWLYSSISLTFSGKVVYMVVKFWVLISFCLYMLGFVALGKIFENYFLKIISYIMICAMVIIGIIDIFKIFLEGDEHLTIIIGSAQSLIAGFASLSFGVALLKLRDSMGTISGYAGGIEIVLGVCFISVILTPVAFALLIPATILEIILLFKGHEFVMSEFS
ncbi:hypothetical protein C900_00820 [Fulvivirga imtechensis AK7]|uniref:HTH cro/C1-type domain-containing protein n=1 Tax=Fulvivirga imtechensis AK7 TaxID=1237149 RepID=L8JYZ5_9BACT|nr:helix-turn-helix transcriptional regulator [Fulvivirga imtechensis]ELR72859.1 hypothetical protein C900_00820 [Fulvivirga imtechensis AK7]